MKRGKNDSEIKRRNSSICKKDQCLVTVKLTRQVTGLNPTATVVTKSRILLTSVCMAQLFVSPVAVVRGSKLHVQYYWHRLLSSITIQRLGFTWSRAQWSLTDVLPEKIVKKGGRAVGIMGLYYSSSRWFYKSTMQL